jgi:hypothetical protein
LILEVDARSAGLDHRLHHLEGVERSAEAGLGIGDDRCKPARVGITLGRVDLIGSQERVVEPPDEGGTAVRRIEALVGIRVSGEVGIGGDLPAAEVDRLQAGLDHLHGLAPG